MKCSVVPLGFGSEEGLEPFSRCPRTCTYMNTSRCISTDIVDIRLKTVQVSSPDMKVLAIVDSITSE